MSNYDNYKIGLFKDSKLITLEMRKYNIGKNNNTASQYSFNYFYIDSIAKDCIKLEFGERGTWIR